MSEERGFPARVAEIIDSRTVVINRGSEDNIKKGDMFLIYSLGKEIIDPENGENLGQLEVVKGKAIVEHIQDYITTIKSCEKMTSDKKIVYKKPMHNSTLLAIMGMVSETKEEIVGTDKIVPFDKVEVGDFVKPI